MEDAQLDKTVFTCSRCGYQTDKIFMFKVHLSRKTVCKPRLSDISFDAIKQEYAFLLRPGSPGKKTYRRRKRMRSFGDEKRDHIKRDMLKDCVRDPLSGVQTVIQYIYCNEEHDENHNIRLIQDDEHNVEILINDVWVRRSKIQVYDKIIYMACDILEYNIAKKYWTTEFRNFVTGMGEMDNDNVLELIREEVESTLLEYAAEKFAKENCSKNEDGQDGCDHSPSRSQCGEVSTVP